jgi:hypothetical protein
MIYCGDKKENLSDHEMSAHQLEEGIDRWRSMIYNHNAFDKYYYRNQEK